MLTATIEQKVFSRHQTSSISMCCTHTHNNSESLLDHFVKRHDWTSSTEITVARPKSVSATVTNNTKITTVYTTNI